MQQMNWYENPTIAAIIGAVIGSVITAAVSIFIWKKQAELDESIALWTMLLHY
jgi:hypothetical protein